MEIHRCAKSSACAGAILLYPAVVKSKLLDRRAIVVIKQQEQAALDVLHKDKNWLSRAWEKFKYNVAQSWTRMVASKTPHDSLREVINKTRTAHLRHDNRIANASARRHFSKTSRSCRRSFFAGSIAYRGHTSCCRRRGTSKA